MYANKAPTNIGNKIGLTTKKERIANRAKMINGKWFLYFILTHPHKMLIHLYFK